MNEERTYGVELELHLTSGSIAGSVPDRYVGTSAQHRCLAQVINQAFLAEGINHFATSSGWGQQTDGHNYHEWVIKTDGSLSPSPFDTHPHSTEIVSPVLKGKAGLRALEIVCKAIEPYVKVSKKCGLHVHHGLRAEEIKPLIRRWLKIERVVLESLPKSRRNGNRFCRPLGRDLGGWDVREPGDSEDLRAWHTANCRDWNSSGSRYTTLNIASFWLRGTVEFRCAAGTYEYDKIANWVIFTQSLLEKQDVPVDKLESIEELVYWIHEEEASRTVQETVERTVEADPLEQVMQQRIPTPSSDPYTWYPGTRFLHCRRGSMAADIDQLLLDGCWLSDAINRIAGNHDRNIAQARSKILTHINFLRGQGVTVEQQGRRGRDVHYQVVPRDRADALSINLPPARPRRERVTVERVIPAGTVHADADFLAAVLWLKQRWLQFNRPRVQQVAAEEEFTLF